eukprot:scaffold6572_cov106-Cylindrotheca_fusiformis.AAC.6
MGRARIYSTYSTVLYNYEFCQGKPWRIPGNQKSGHSTTSSTGAGCPSKMYDSRVRFSSFANLVQDDFDIFGEQFGETDYEVMDILVMFIGRSFAPPHLSKAS